MAIADVRKLSKTDKFRLPWNEFLIFLSRQVRVKVINQTSRERRQLGFRKLPINQTFTMAKQKATNVSPNPIKTKKPTGMISKTKAKAMRHKPAPVVLKVGADAGGGRNSSDQVLLAKLMESHLLEADQKEKSGLSFAAIMSSLGMNDHNTGWRNSWKDLEKKGLTQQVPGGNGGFFTSGFCLTKEGLDAFATDDNMKEAMAVISEKQPKTNEEHQNRIKSKLMNKRGEEIFDVLLKHGPLSRKEIAAKLGISDRGAYFSYALQQLKDLGYVRKVRVIKEDGKEENLNELTDKCFVSDPRNQSDSIKVDQDSLAHGK